LPAEFYQKFLGGNKTGYDANVCIFVLLWITSVLIKFWCYDSTPKKRRCEYYWTITANFPT
jgi:hypothetical protein